MDNTWIDILDVMVLDIASYLTISDILRLSETAPECHTMCNDRGFESALLQLNGIHRNGNCSDRLPIKSLLGLFRDQSITCKAYMGYTDTSYWTRCTPCIFTMHWNGCTFTTTPMEPFMYHNIVYESIFFSWSVLLSWAKEKYKNTQCLSIDLVPNTYVNTVHKINVVRILFPETDTAYYLSERLLNRCCMLELLQNGAFGVQYVRQITQLRC
jgi:hypothetical protein